MTTTWPATCDEHDDGCRGPRTSGRACRTGDQDDAEHEQRAEERPGQLDEAAPRQERATAWCAAPTAEQRRRSRPGRPGSAASSRRHPGPLAGTAPPPRERALRADLRPSSCQTVVEPVARAERHGAPALLGRAGRRRRRCRRPPERPRRRRRGRRQRRTRRACCIRRSTACRIGLDARRGRRPPGRRGRARPASRSRAGVLGRLRRTASASSSGAVLSSASRRCQAVPGSSPVGGDQPHGEAALAQVHRDRRRGGHRRLERRRDALPAVGRDAGCRGRASPGTATAAPRGAPSARRPGPCCASAPGAGRRRGGTRAR